MEEIYKKKLHGIVSEIMEADYLNNEFKSVVSTFYSIIENGEIEKLDILLRFNFPYYYDSEPPMNINFN